MGSLGCSISIFGSRRDQVCWQTLTGGSQGHPWWRHIHWTPVHIWEYIIIWITVNTLRPWRNGRYNADDIFKCIFLKEIVWIPTKISLKFVPKGPINNIPALVQIMDWRRSGDKPLSEPMMVSLLTHIGVTRPQWVKYLIWGTPNTKT